MKRLVSTGIALIWAFSALLLAAPSHATATGDLVALFDYTAHDSTVNFTDLSQGTGIIKWHWDFGDGGTSSAQDPTHGYANVGNFSVSMTITDVRGYTSTAQKIVRVSTLTQSTLIPSALSWIIPMVLLALGVFGLIRTGNPFIQVVCAVLIAIGFMFLFVIHV